MNTTRNNKIFIGNRGIYLFGGGGWAFTPYKTEGTWADYVLPIALGVLTIAGLGSSIAGSIKSKPKLLSSSSIISTLSIEGNNSEVEATEDSGPDNIGLAYGGPIYHRFADGGAAGVFDKIGSGAQAVQSIALVYQLNAAIDNAAVNAAKQGAARKFNLKVSANSFDSLMADWGHNTNAATAYNWRDFYGASDGKRALNTFIGSSNAAMLGFKAGGMWGAIAGGVGGLISGFLGSGAARRRAKRQAREANQAGLVANTLKTNQFIDRANMLNKQQNRVIARSFTANGGPLNFGLIYGVGGALGYDYMNSMLANKRLAALNKLSQLSPINMDYSSYPLLDGNSLFSFGGNLGTNGADFTDGLTYFDNGGRHEENPNQGIPLGIAPDGLPNLVELGEVKWNELEYIFSDRLTVSPEFVERWNLPKSYTEKTYAYVVKNADVIKEAELRPNDASSLDNMDLFLQELQLDLEITKLAKEAKEMQEQLANMSPEELAALGLQLQLLDIALLAQQPDNLGQQPADYQLLQQGAELEYADLLALQQLVALLEGLQLPMMGACGGKLHAEGGDMASAELSLNMEELTPQTNPFTGAVPQEESQMEMPEPQLAEEPQPIAEEPLLEEQTRKPAEEMSTRELNDAIEEIIEFAKEHKDRQLLREAKAIKRKGSREEKEEFVDDAYEEIDEILAEELSKEQPTEKVPLLEEVPQETPQEPMAMPEELEAASLQQPSMIMDPMAQGMMAEGGEISQQVPQEEQQQQVNPIELLLQIGDLLGLAKDGVYTEEEVEALKQLAALAGIDLSILQTDTKQLTLILNLTILLNQPQEPLMSPEELLMLEQLAAAPQLRMMLSPQGLPTMMATGGFLQSPINYNHKYDLGSYLALANKVWYGSFNVKDAIEWLKKWYPQEVQNELSSEDLVKKAILLRVKDLKNLHALSSDVEEEYNKLFNTSNEVNTSNEDDEVSLTATEKRFQNKINSKLSDNNLNTEAYNKYLQEHNITPNTLKALDAISSFLRELRLQERKEILNINAAKAWAKSKGVSYVDNTTLLAAYNKAPISEKKEFSKEAKEIYDKVVKEYKDREVDPSKLTTRAKEQFNSDVQKYVEGDETLPFLRSTAVEGAYSLKAFNDKANEVYLKSKYGENATIGKYTDYSNPDSSALKNIDEITNPDWWKTGEYTTNSYYGYKAPTKGYDFTTIYGNNGEAIQMPIATKAGNTGDFIYNAHKWTANEDGKYKHKDGNYYTKLQFLDKVKDSKQAFIQAIKGGNSDAINMLKLLGTATSLNKKGENLYFDNEGKLRKGWEDNYIHQSGLGEIDTEWGQNHGYFEEKETPGERTLYRTEDGRLVEYDPNNTRYKIDDSLTTTEDKEDGWKVTTKILKANPEGRKFLYDPESGNFVLIDNTDGLTPYIHPDYKDSKRIYNVGDTTVTDEFYIDPTKKTPEEKKEDNLNKDYKPLAYNNLLRMMPLLNTPELDSYNSANMMANSANNLVWIGAPRHGEYLKYQPVDSLYRINQLQSDNNAARRGIMNAANGNTGLLMANLALQNSKALSQLGEQMLGIDTENWSRMKDVIGLHNETDKTWDLMALDADKANMSNNQYLHDAAVKAADLNYKIESGNNDAIAAARADKLGLLHKIGTENDNLDRFYAHQRWMGRAAEGGEIRIRRKTRNRNYV